MTERSTLKLILSVEATDQKHFFSYRFPNGQTFKTEILTALRSQTTVQHDIAVDKAFIASFYHNPIEISLLKLTSKPQKTTSKPQKKEKQNSKHTRIRNHGQTQKTSPKPHHFEIPEKSLDKKPVRPQTSGIHWDLLKLSSEIISDQQNQQQETSEFRSSTPPLPHHFDLPEKHHFKTDYSQDPTPEQSPTLPRQKTPILPHQTRLLKQTEFSSLVKSFQIPITPFLQGDAEFETNGVHISFKLPVADMNPLYISIDTNKSLRHLPITMNRNNHGKSHVILLDLYNEETIQLRVGDSIVTVQISDIINGCVDKAIVGGGYVRVKGTAPEWKSGSSGEGRSGNSRSGMSGESEELIQPPPSPLEPRIQPPPVRLKTPLTVVEQVTEHDYSFIPNGTRIDITILSDSISNGAEDIQAAKEKKRMKNTITASSSSSSTKKSNDKSELIQSLIEEATNSTIYIYSTQKLNTAEMLREKIEKIVLGSKVF